MAPLRSVSRSEGLSARRWDALILGSGIAALVAASRISMTGRRVLVVEEDVARSAFPGLREPFLLAGARDRGLVDACLRELSIPLIDRRRIEERALALQVVAPDVRLDVGDADLSAQELVGWDVAKPDDARSLVRALAESAEAERRAMLGSAVVRVGRRLARPAPGTQGSHVRGLPAEAARAPGALRTLLRAQVRALSNLAAAEPGPEARARLLGSVLAGGAAFTDGPPWLAGLLRQRAKALHVEFRSLTGPFELVQNRDEPGLMTAQGQLLVGRRMIVAAPGTAVARQMEPDAAPEILGADRTCRRRLALHFVCKPSALPEAMSDRVVLAPADGADPADLGVVTLALSRSPEVSANVDLVARAVVPVDARTLGPADLSPWEDRIEERVRELLRFAKKKLARRRTRLPVWDDDDWLEDPPPGHGWPAEIDLRACSRPPVYRLDRAGVAGLGLEGDLLLGLRGGDALAAEL